MTNLTEGLRKEIKRNEELLKEYKEIGPPGIFGVTTITALLERANKAIDDGNTVEMLKVYTELEGTK